MSTVPRFSCAIVSYQVRDLLANCLVSVEAQRDVDVDVIVVDNASTDGSADMVAARFPRVRIIRNSENRGFARATNQGLAACTGEYLVLLNPDTELPPDAFTAAAAVFGRYPEAGAVGLCLVNGDGSVQPACHAFPGVANQLVESLGLQRLALSVGYGTPSAAPVPGGGEGPVDWVSGACLILCRRAFAKVGGLDESSFMYGEEMDWCWRALEHGFRTVFSNRVQVVHHGGASGEGARGDLFVHNIRSRLSFLRRHRRAWRARVSREILFGGALLRWLYWSARLVWERPVGSVRPRTLDQRARFGAVVAWRLSGAQ